MFEVSRVGEHVDAIGRGSVRIARSETVSIERGGEGDDGPSPSVPS